MRVFLSVYPGFTLAIPMEAVASMMLYNQETEKTVQYEPKSRCTFISLPWLFNMRDQPVPHGVILREWNSKENKVVLLTAEVKSVIEIPDNEFYPIPKSLAALRFSAVFSGIKFSDNPVLLLNIKQLLEVIQNEQWKTESKPNPPEPQPSPAAVSEPSPPPPDKIVEEPLASPAVVSEPSPPPPIEVIEEPSTSPAVTLEPSPSTLNEVIDEPPASPAAAAPEPPPPPDKVVEEPPISSPAETSEPSSLALDEVLEPCEIIEEPPTSPAVTIEVYPPPHEVIEDIEVCEIIEGIEVCEVVEDIEVCEIIEDTEACEVIGDIDEPPSPMGTSETFSLTLNEAIELCEII